MMDKTQSAEAGDAGGESLDVRLAKEIVGYWCRGSVPEDEWDRPVTYSSDLKKILTLRDIKEECLDYVSVLDLDNLPIHKIAKLVSARINFGTTPLRWFRDWYHVKTSELAMLLRQKDPGAQDVAKTFISTACANLIWYENFYKPDE